MKKLFGILILINAFSTAFSQAVIDSLEKKLASSILDTNRVTILSSLSIAYAQSNHELGMKYAQEGLLLSRKLGFKSGEADCLRRSGLILFFQGRFPEALDAFQKSVGISEKINHSFGLAAGFGHIGNVYLEQEDYSKARQYFHLALRAAEELNNPQEVANALRAFGRSYLRQKQLDSALHYYKRMYAIIEGKSYNRLHALLNSDYGQLQAQLGNSQLAMTFFKKSIFYAQSEAAFNVLNSSYLGIADLFRTSGQRDSAVYYAVKALEAAEQNNYRKGLLDANKALSQVYEGNDDLLAFKFLKKATSINDSLFTAEKATQVQNMFFLEDQRKQTVENARIEYKNQLRFYFLVSALAIFFLAAILLYRNNRLKQRANTLLERQKIEINEQRNKAEQTLAHLKTTQTQLIQSEKMASLGELTAGIAHEIQNPLNFVNNFSEVNRELIEEMKEEIEKGNFDEAKSIATNIEENEQKIIQHGRRADAIVKGMLQHSRTSTGQKEATDLNTLVDEYMRLSYHGLRAKDKSFNATMKTNLDASIGKVSIIPQDIGRVLLNLFNNAFYSVTEKRKKLGEPFQPLVSATTHLEKGDTKKIIIRIQDNGLGIPASVVDKIFQPFFTTKPTGQGTGLGLSLSYDIIKAHGGELKIETTKDEFAEFIIILPAS